MIVALAHTAIAADLTTMAPVKIVTKTGMEQEDVKDLAAGVVAVVVEAIGGVIEGTDIPVVCQSAYLVSAWDFANN